MIKNEIEKMIEKTDKINQYSFDMILKDMNTDNYLFLQSVKRKFIKDFNSLLPVIKKQDALLKEAIKILKRNLKDCDSIDKVCQIAQVHNFDLMRKKINDFLEKVKGNDA